MSNSFTNLSILECNRQSSEEAKIGNDTNPALFTNKLGTGVKINVGDTIQVSSAFISEQGAGDENTIEFKGADLNATHTIEYLNPTFTEPYDTSIAREGFAKITWNASTSTINLKDNKASVVINYYKSANGENYYQLPRKFMAYRGDTGLGGSVNASGSHNLWFAQEDSPSQGNASYSKGGLPFHQVPYFTTTDQKLYYCDADYYYLSSGVYDDYSRNIQTGQIYKIRNNGERYTIYVAKENYYVSELDSTGEPTGVSNPAPNTYWVNELSQREYLRYSEKIDLEVNVGFNSALDIANTLTDQLQNTGEVKNLTYPYNDELVEPYFYPSKKITTYLESRTYKTFPTTNASQQTDIVYGFFNGSHGYPTDTDNTPSQEVINYINSTNFIGIKRPDLYDKGIFVANLLTDTSNNYFTIAPELTINYGVGTDRITTNIKFNSTNIALLLNLFNEEEKHPELFKNEFNEYGQTAFDGTGTTINNSRFLHLNSRRYIHSTSTDMPQLGTDDCSDSNSYFDSSADNYISLPIFFYFDTARKNISEGGDDENNLYNGFALRSASDTIAFYTGTNASFCPAPARYRQYNNNKPSGSSILSGTYIGWDTHFTAFSTCAIALTDGWINELWNGGNKPKSYWEVGTNAVWDTTGAVSPNSSSSQAISPINQLPYISKIYLGSNNPLVSFNASSNRFAISQLHTAEFEGNPSNAGGTNASFTIPLNPNADRKVYKINKRNNCFSWTPALVPYTAIDSKSASGTDEFELELPNRNLDNWTIFDSQSGIIIKDFGFGNDSWNNGLWGILGFTYNQFNSSRTSNNDITGRITDRNFQELPYAFTNANVSASDSIDFIVNGWGSPMYNSMLPVNFIWNGTGQTSASNIQGVRQGFRVENPPPIVKQQESIELTAVNLPRRMIRPYFCIRSSILADSHYLGGSDSGQALPVVSVVNKIDGYGDFYFSNQSDFIFTATKEYMLTDIITSIHAPDQTFAKVDNDSAVIYKITKNQPAVSNVVEELLQEKVLTKKDLQKL